MKNSIKYSNQVKAKAIEMFMSGRFNTADIADCLGTYNSTVSRWIDRYLGKNEKNICGLKSKV